MRASLTLPSAVSIQLGQPSSIASSTTEQARAEAQAFAALVADASAGLVDPDPNSTNAPLATGGERTEEPGSDTEDPTTDAPAEAAAAVMATTAAPALLPVSIERLLLGSRAATDALNSGSRVEASTLAATSLSGEVRAQTAWEGPTSSDTAAAGITPGLAGASGTNAGSARPAQETSGHGDVQPTNTASVGEHIVGSKAPDGSTEADPGGGASAVSTLLAAGTAAVQEMSDSSSLASHEQATITSPNTAEESHATRGSPTRGSEATAHTSVVHPAAPTTRGKVGASLPERLAIADTGTSTPTTPTTTPTTRPTTRPTPQTTTTAPTTTATTETTAPTVGPATQPPAPAPDHAANEHEDTTVSPATASASTTAEKTPATASASAADSQPAIETPSAAMTGAATVPASQTNTMRAAASATSAADQPSARVDHFDTEQLVGAARRFAGRDGTHEMSIELNPRGLGSVAMQIVVEGNTVHLQVHAENSDTTRLIRSHLEDLRASLRDGGLDAGRLDVADQGTRQGWQQRSDSTPQQGWTRTTASARIGAPAEPKRPTPATTPHPSAPALGRLDLQL